MSQEGININITNNLIDITYMNRISIYQSLAQCEVFDNPGMANN